ncbi:hypothetical protein MSAR_04860 [Mycolicibacterium sarraceniae]|uniref:Uncharacterized protein n=1 Tax=Mycolicibacterium sarraceniae TaxID=1534348 RepID=A0A7I7SLG9_9MYCO|nr:hypothetical protein MSAR_04860 [Mycolicibacterium sarraceniae]
MRRPPLRCYEPLGAYRATSLFPPTPSTTNRRTRPRLGLEDSISKRNSRHLAPSPSAADLALARPARKQPVRKTGVNPRYVDTKRPAHIDIDVVSPQTNPGGMLTF